jgi:hypothetical protein
LAVLDDQFAISGQDRRAMHQDLIAGVNHGAIVEANVSMKAFETVADLDGAGHSFR